MFCLLTTLMLPVQNISGKNNFRTVKQQSTEEKLSANIRII